MSRGNIGLGDERPLFTLGGRHLRRPATDDRAFDVVLSGLTPAAEAGFLPARALRLARLPFRIGRIPVAGETQPLEVNDLQLSDTKPFHVSRNHFTIERGPDGVQVRDRGSYVGTIVNSLQVGGDRRVGTAPLAVGENEVVAGSPNSPFRFRVVVALRQPDPCPEPEHDSAYAQRYAQANEEGLKTAGFEKRLADTPEKLACSSRAT
jgi:hypothetical protein